MKNYPIIPVSAAHYPISLAQNSHYPVIPKPFQGHTLLSWTGNSQPSPANACLPLVNQLSRSKVISMQPEMTFLIVDRALIQAPTFAEKEKFWTLARPNYPWRRLESSGSESLIPIDRGAIIGGPRPPEKSFFFMM